MSLAFLFLAELIELASHFAPFHLYILCVRYQRNGGEIMIIIVNELKIQIDLGRIMYSWCPGLAE